MVPVGQVRLRLGRGLSETPLVLVALDLPAEVRLHDRSHALDLRPIRRAEQF
jgi:hypothetical protein